MREKWEKLVLLWLLIFLSGCQEQVSINGINYSTDGEVMVQLNKINTTYTKFAVLSDIHGAAENVAYFVDYFTKKRIDGFFLPGDMVEHFRNNQPDDLELEEVLSIVADSGLPAFIIPGNHEPKDVYYSVIKRIGRKNVIDMTKVRRVDLEQVTILSLPGYNLKSFVAENGFFFDGFDEVKAFASSAKKRILLSHQIPESKRIDGIDVTFSGQHAGNGQLNRFLAEKKIDVTVGSHIHEAGGQAENHGGFFVPQNYFSETLYLNPGSVTPWKFRNGTAFKGLAALLTINKTHASYEVIAR